MELYNISIIESEVIFEQALSGQIIAFSYREYDVVSEKTGYAELNSFEVWNKIKETIKEVASLTSSDPIQALSVCSLGEAFIPVTKDKKILHNSILGLDSRGSEFIEALLNEISEKRVYQKSGNIPGAFYSMPKIAWLKKYQPEIYLNTDYFLLWADFVCYMLGGNPVTTYSLANRTLLFDIHTKNWSQELFNILNLDMSRFAPAIQSGEQIGIVSQEIGAELNLPSDVCIISGGHDQCCSSFGSGNIDSNIAMYGMGTYICVEPVLSEMSNLDSMWFNKLHIEHYVLPDKYISFLYNMSGGALIKWFKNTFARDLQFKDNEHSYKLLFKEIPDEINDIIVIPRFGPTGPPDFNTEPAGSIFNLSFDHTRGDILRSLIEGMTFYFKEHLPIFEKQGVTIDALIASGGGAVSEIWLQITADILNKPIMKNKFNEAGALGAAILAGIGCNQFNSYYEGVDLMVERDARDYFLSLIK